ncbi:MAG: hypothetical protein WCK07_06970 [Betaproteobacteria bacterium]
MKTFKTVTRDCCAVGLMGICAVASAQNYPAKPVRVIVPFPPAGAADIVARHAANGLSEGLSVQFVVETAAVLRVRSVPRRRHGPRPTATR